MLRSVKYGVYGAVLAGVVGGTVAFTAASAKTVHLQVDGQARTVHTTATEVKSVLKGAGYTLGSHDIVAPAATASVKNDSTIVYRRGRLLHLWINGVEKNIWTTAPTVAAALAQLGYPSTSFISVSRSMRLPLSATSLTISTPKQLTVEVLGHSRQVTTTALTVSQLLDDLGVTVGPHDKVSARGVSALYAGEVLKVDRVEHKTVTTTKSIPFATTTVSDPSLADGQTEIVTPGQAGSEQIEYAVVYINGKAVAKARINTVVTQAPTKQVVHVGTGSSGGSGSSGGTGGLAPAGSDPAAAQALAQSMLGSYGWGGDQFQCLVTLWDHESGWRVNAANPSGAYGIPQALPGSKMASAGPNWQSDARTQIAWGLGYIQSRYNNPCQAWSDWQANGGWY